MGAISVAQMARVKSGKEPCKFAEAILGKMVNDYQQQGILYQKPESEFTSYGVDESMIGEGQKDLAIKMLNAALDACSS